MKKIFALFILGFVAFFANATIAEASRPHPMHIGSASASCSGVYADAGSYTQGATITIGTSSSDPAGSKYTIDTFTVDPWVGDGHDRTGFGVPAPSPYYAFGWSVHIEAPDWPDYDEWGQVGQCMELPKPTTTTTIPEETTTTTIPEETTTTTISQETTTTVQRRSGTTVPKKPVITAAGDCAAIHVFASGFNPEDTMTVYDGNDVVTYPVADLTIDRPQPTSEGYFQVIGPDDFDTGLVSISGCHDQLTTTTVSPATTVADVPVVTNPEPAPTTVFIPDTTQLPATGSSVFLLLVGAVVFVGVGILLVKIARRRAAN